MYSLATHKSISHAYAYNQCDYVNASTHSSLLWLFKGPVPQSFAEIPHEWIINPAMMMRNAVGMVELNGNIVPQSKDLISNYSTKNNWQRAKGNSYDSNLERWCLDCTVLLERTHRGIEFYPDDENPALMGGNQPQVYKQYRKYYLDLAMVDCLNLSTYYYDPSKNPITSANNFPSNYGRYCNNYPLIFEFETEQNIDGLFMRQSSVNYASDFVDIQAWDSVNEVWLTSFRVLLHDGYDPSLVTFDAVTTTRLRCVFNQTNSQDWYPGFFQWVSTTEPSDKKDPYDITWGLVSWIGGNVATDFHANPSLTFNWFENETIHNQTQGYPYLLVDVGSPGDNTTVILNNSKGVLPKDSINVLHMGLNFKDVE